MRVANEVKKIDPDIKVIHFEIMAKSKVGLNGQQTIESKPKRTRQGSGQHTKLSATSRNGAKKRYRGQGRG